VTSGCATTTTYGATPPDVLFCIRNRHEQSFDFDGLCERYEVIVLLQWGEIACRRVPEPPPPARFPTTPRLERGWDCSADLGRGWRNDLFGDRPTASDTASSEMVCSDDRVSRRASCDHCPPAAVSPPADVPKMFGYDHHWREHSEDCRPKGVVIGLPCWSTGSHTTA